MSCPIPKKITVQYDDGIGIEANFADLPYPFRQELLRQPAFSQANPAAGKENFVLLEWEDGWCEVLQVDPGCCEINRYYVISRPEDVGRLSLKKSDSYPELIEIIRRPMELKSVAFLGTYELSLERSVREGKKVDHFFSLKKVDDILEKEIKHFQMALIEEGIDLEALSNQGSAARTLEKIARRMGIVASRRQQDLLDFMACLANMLRKQGSSPR